MVHNNQTNNTNSNLNNSTTSPYRNSNNNSNGGFNFYNNNNNNNTSSLTPKKRLMSNEDLINGLDSNVRQSAKKQYGSFNNHSRYSLMFLEDLQPSSNNQQEQQQQQSPKKSVNRPSPQLDLVPSFAPASLKLNIKANQQQFQNEQQQQQQQQNYNQQPPLKQVQIQNNHIINVQNPQQKQNLIPPPLPKPSALKLSLNTTGLKLSANTILKLNQQNVNNSSSTSTTTTTTTTTTTGNTGNTNISNKNENDNPLVISFKPQPPPKLNTNNISPPINNINTTSPVLPSPSLSSSPFVNTQQQQPQQNSNTSPFDVTYSDSPPPKPFDFFSPFDNGNDNDNNNNNKTNNNSIKIFKKTKNEELNEQFENFLGSYRHSNVAKDKNNNNNNNSSQFNNDATINNANDGLNNYLQLTNGSTISNNNNNNIETLSIEEIKTLIPDKLFQRFAISLENNITNIITSDLYEPCLLPIPTTLPSPLYNALTKMELKQLYSHQIESREKILQGGDIIVTTPTASGKSLCLCLPIFEEIIKCKIQQNSNSIQSPKQPPQQKLSLSTTLIGSRLGNSNLNSMKSTSTTTTTTNILNNQPPKQCKAIFLFPLNALANDQLKSITKLNSFIDQPYALNIQSISGGSSPEEIAKIFKNDDKSSPDIVLTNPDWLHYQLYRGGSGEQWKGWRTWFSNLRFIVLDEIHTYSGVMGCHFINLLRRITNYHNVLNNVTNSDHSSTPTTKLQYLLASATVGNPKQIALKVIGRQLDSNMHLIDKNGSGSFGRIFITLKPVKNSYHLSSMVIHQWVNNNIKGIVFCNTIKGLNNLLHYMSVNSQFSSTSKSVRPYYSSLTSTSKQETISLLKSGQIKVIVSTNALEAGVDISELNACMIIGYPGSKMSFRQRIGRVGRSKLGLVIFLPDSYSPIDKYYSKNPSSLFDGNSETLTFNGEFPSILKSHLLCATSEIGIPSDYEYLKRIFGNNAENIINQLILERKIKETSTSTKTTTTFNPNQQQQSHNNRLLWKTMDRQLQNHLSLSLRGGSGTNDMIAARINYRDGAIVERVSKLQAITRLFPGSVFMTHNSEGKLVNYEVQLLDLKPASVGGGYAILKYLSSMSSTTNVTTTPNRQGSVEMKQILKQKTIDLLLDDSVKLLISFGVGICTTTVNSYEKKTSNFNNQYNNSRYDNDNYLLSKCESESITLKQPLVISYEAPCIQFTFTDSIKNILRPILNQKIDQLRTKIQNCLFDKKEYESKIHDLMEMGETKVSLHTIVHQILSSFPTLILSSKSDIDETISTCNQYKYCGSDIGDNNNQFMYTNSHHNSSTIQQQQQLPIQNDKKSNYLFEQQQQYCIYLTDNVEGGTGTCEDIFDNLKDVLKKSIEIDFCPNCTDSSDKESVLIEDLGCIFCLHSTNFCKNHGLLKSLGVVNLNLDSIN
eukprot:gene7698-9469_t